MASRKKRVVGEGTSDEIANRSGLRSQKMPHGEVYRGELADRALRAVGARAMTIDGEIIVNHQFSPQDAADQALYAHEMYHQEQSGGVAGSSIRDAEEVSARAVEAMVFHRAKSGEGDPIPRKASELLEDDKSKKDADSGEDPEMNTESKDIAEPNASRGYSALIAEGLDHQEIVQQVAEKIVDEMTRNELLNDDRGGKLRGYVS